MSFSSCCGLEIWFVQRGACFRTSDPSSPWPKFGCLRNGRMRLGRSAGHIRNHRCTRLHYRVHGRNEHSGKIEHASCTPARTRRCIATADCRVMSWRCRQLAAATASCSEPMMLWQWAVGRARSPLAGPSGRLAAFHMSHGKTTASLLQGFGRLPALRITNPAASDNGACTRLRPGLTCGDESLSLTHCLTDQPLVSALLLSDNQTVKCGSRIDLETVTFQTSSQATHATSATKNTEFDLFPMSAFPRSMASISSISISSCTSCNFMHTSYSHSAFALQKRGLSRLSAFDQEHHLQSGVVRCGPTFQ